LILTRKIITKQEGREVVFVTELHCPLPWSEFDVDMRTSLRASATINRRDFGLGQSVAVRFAASSMVNIEIDLEAVEQSVEMQDAAVTVD
jgi:polyisoprenoid-binding protein YceI